ncbi:MAG TPA: BatA domain-containing protein [Opitutaceae bacterium]|nr:BatA domain-containing protein [Opitutaceae bacterium]
MNFLAPLFLVGGAAIALPVIYHLIRRTTRERTVFSSLMFLLPSPPRLSRRHRLEHLLLLLLRCLALALLALGFARPFLRQASLDDPTSARPTRLVVLVDTSASMRRDGVWAAAQEQAAAALRATGPADQAAVFTFDRETRPLVSFEEWNRTLAGDRVAMATARLAAVAPGWNGTHLGSALIAAAEALGETDAKAAPGPRQVVLVSDLQAGSRLDTLQAYDWPKGVALTVRAVKAAHATNAGLQLVAPAADANSVADSAIRVRVSNSADAKREQFTVGWARRDAPGEILGAPIDVYVPPGQSRVVAVPLAKSTPAPDRISLRGDDDPFDNTVYAIPPAREQVGVLWLGSDAADDVRQPRFFLERALTGLPGITVKTVARAPAAPITAAEIAAANLVFVSEPLPAATTAALREQAMAGKTIVFAPKSADAGRTLGALLGRDDVRLEDAQPSNYAMFGEIDFRHPLFAAFADPRYSDFTKIHIWKYRKLDAAEIPGVRVLAKFDSGDPAVIEAPVGQGRIFVLATGWQPADSQLAVSSKFVPLLWALLDLSGGIESAPAQFFVGDRTPVPAGTTTVRLADGTSAALPNGAKDFAAPQPGIFEFTGGAKPQRFAVNLDANESRTAPLAADELERLGVPIAQEKPDPAASPANKRVLQAIETENRQKLWRWFIAATLAVLLIESALAGWAARRSTLQTEEVPS